MLQDNNTSFIYNCCEITLYYRIGGGSIDIYLIQFTADVPEFVKTRFAYQNAIGLSSYIMVENMQNPISAV